MKSYQNYFYSWGRKQWVRLSPRSLDRLCEWQRVNEIEANANFSYRKEFLQPTFWEWVRQGKSRADAWDLAIATQSPDGLIGWENEFNIDSCTQVISHSVERGVRRLCRIAWRRNGKTALTDGVVTLIYPAEISLGWLRAQACRQICLGEAGPDVESCDWNAVEDMIFSMVEQRSRNLDVTSKKCEPKLKS